MNLHHIPIALHNSLLSTFPDNLRVILTDDGLTTSLNLNIRFLSREFRHSLVIILLIFLAVKIFIFSYCTKVKEGRKGTSLQRRNQTGSETSFPPLPRIVFTELPGLISSPCEDICKVM